MSDLAETNAQKETEEQKKARAEFLQELINAAESEMHNFLMTVYTGGDLTATQRRRLIGSGVRNYGFIDKAFDIARDNPEFMPPHFAVDFLADSMHYLEELRQLMFILQQYTQAVSDAFLLQSDSCYRDALRIYGSLREQARNRVKGAEALFNALRTFFSRGRRPSETPTEDELERDFKRLIHGKADGEIIIENESPRVSGGIHNVIDNVHTGKSAFKETLEENVDEGKTEHKK